MHARTRTTARKRPTSERERLDERERLEKNRKRINNPNVNLTVMKPLTLNPRQRSLSPNKQV
jgi:hypothetical protein